VGSAAHQVAASLWLLSSFTLDALAVAAQALVADARGAGDDKRARAVARQALVLGVLAGAAFTVVLEAIPSEGIVGLFSSDPQVVAACVPLLSILALAQPINGFVFVSDGILQGYRAFRFEAIAMLSATGAAALVLCGLVVWHASGGLGLQLADLQQSPWPMAGLSDWQFFSLQPALTDVWTGIASLMVFRAVAFILWWNVP